MTALDDEIIVTTVGLFIISVFSKILRISIVFLLEIKYIPLGHEKPYALIC